MFTAIILYCGVGLTDCGILLNHVIYETQEECMESLKYGIATVEGNGAFVRDWRCIAWGEDA